MARWTNIKDDVAWIRNQMCVETNENDTKSWNDRPSGDTIESTDRMGGRNTIYLGNVGSWVGKKLALTSQSSSSTP